MIGVLLLNVVVLLLESIQEVLGILSVRVGQYRVIIVIVSEHLWLGSYVLLGIRKQIVRLNSLGSCLVQHLVELELLLLELYRVRHRLIIFEDLLRTVLIKVILLILIVLFFDVSYQLLLEFLVYLLVPLFKVVAWLFELRVVEYVDSRHQGLDFITDIVSAADWVLSKVKLTQ